MGLEFVSHGKGTQSRGFPFFPFSQILSSAEELGPQRLQVGNSAGLFQVIWSAGPTAHPTNSALIAVNGEEKGKPHRTLCPEASSGSWGSCDTAGQRGLKGSVPGSVCPVSACYLGS